MMIILFLKCMINSPSHSLDIMNLQRLEKHTIELEWMNVMKQVGDTNSIYTHGVKDVQQNMQERTVKH